MKGRFAHLTAHGFVRNLTNPIYLSAMNYWVLRKLSNIQFHKVYVTNLSATSPEGQPQGSLKISVLAQPEDIDHLPEGLEIQINEQSGMSCRSLCERGSRLYVIHDGQNIACQLNINMGEIDIDSPIDLRVKLQNGDTFLNYLFTRDKFRGRGLAGELLGYACNDLALLGKQRCFAHVRATNHASRKTFERSGWKECGKIVTTVSGRFIAAPGCAQSGIRISPSIDTDQ